MSFKPFSNQFDNLSFKKSHHLPTVGTLCKTKSLFET